MPHTSRSTLPVCLTLLLNPSFPALQASDRVYYLYQTLADMAGALGATPEGQQALAEAQQQLGAASSSSEPAAAAAAAAVTGEGPAAGGKGGGKGGSKGGKPAGPSPGVQLLAEVEAALADDFNTPLAIAAFSAPLKVANDLLHTKKVRRIPAGAAAAQPAQTQLAFLAGQWQGSAASAGCRAGPCPHLCCPAALPAPRDDACTREWSPRPLAAQGHHLSSRFSCPPPHAGEEGGGAAADAGQPARSAADSAGAAGAVGRAAGGGAGGAARAGAEAVRPAEGMQEVCASC